MPRYASLADMKARFEDSDLVQLTDEAGTGAIDEARIDRALGKAAALITGKVAVRHANADAFAAHPLLADLACDLAFADLWRGDLPDWVKERAKSARAQLGDIAAGTLKLDEGVETEAPRPGAIIVDGPPKKFDRQSLDSF